MKTTKPQKLTTVPFVEGGNLNQILFQLPNICRKMLLTLSGTITISAKVGTIVPTIKAAGDGSIMFPYLLQLFGKLTFNGACKSGKGIKINNLPFWVLWLEAYILNGGVGPVVNDGGMLAANFAAGTYTVSMAVPVNFFDPMTPKAQHPFTYFRPVRYDKQPNWQITGGTLFQANYQSNVDGVALTGDTVANSSLTYTTNLTVNASAFLIPDLAQGVQDQCADICYEYSLQPNLKQASYNNVSLADLEVQQYIHMINTDLSAVAGGGTALVEAGSDTMGNANNGIIETDLGTKPIAQIYAVNQKANDIDEFLESISVWPAGLLTIDEYGHNWAEWDKKTILDPNAPAHLVNAYGVPNASGSNFKIIHKTAQLSTSAKNKVGKFPAFAGA